MKMLTKMKIAIVMCGSLLFGGVALAQPAKDRSSGSEADKAEWKAKRAAKKQEMLQRFDTNRNGVLEDAEKTAMKDTLLAERFKQLDLDGNGVLSLAEFKAGKHKMGKRGHHKRNKGSGHMMRGFTTPNGLAAK
jgi:hypothetical protein